MGSLSIVYAAVALFVFQQHAEAYEYWRAYNFWQNLVLFGNTCVKLQQFRTGCERVAPICRQANCRIECPCPGISCSRDCPCPGINCPIDCPVNCGASCPVNCANSCPVNCATSCPVNCGIYCPVNCANSCPVNCANSCPVDCATSCPVDCATSCPVNCATSCPFYFAAACPPPTNGNYKFCTDAIASTPSGKVTYTTGDFKPSGGNPSCKFTISVPGKTITVICTTDSSRVNADDGIDGSNLGSVNANPGISHASSVTLTATIASNKADITCSWTSA